jgi:hypothetical protein
MHILESGLAVESRHVGETTPGKKAEGSAQRKAAEKIALSGHEGARKGAAQINGGLSKANTGSSGASERSATIPTRMHWKLVGRERESEARSAVGSWQQAGWWGVVPPS